MDLKTLEKYKSVKFDFFKILSLAFDNNELIKKAINTRKKTYLSTGFSDLQSIARVGKIFKYKFHSY